MKIIASAQDSDASAAASWLDSSENEATLQDYYHVLQQPVSTSLFAQSKAVDGGSAFASFTAVPTPDAQTSASSNAPTEFHPLGDGFTFSSNIGGGAHGGGGSGGGGTPAPWATQPIAGNNLNFIINWDSSVGKAPSGFVTAFETAVLNLQKSLNSVFPDTITLNVGWGEAGGSRLSFGALGESLTNINQESYPTLYNTLSPYAYLPDPNTTGDPISGVHSYWMASAEQRALGLGPISGSPDGSVGFSSSVSWKFGTGTGSGYDFISVAEHEISEAMGRIGLLGATISDNGTIYKNGYSPMDLFRYSAPGQLSLVGGQTAYFSPNGGSSSGSQPNNLTGSNFTYFNTTAGGDWGDWQSSGATSAGTDAYTAFASSGTQYALSNTDQTLMAVLGYHS